MENKSCIYIGASLNLTLYIMIAISCNLRLVKVGKLAQSNNCL